MCSGVLFPFCGSYIKDLAQGSLGKEGVKQGHFMIPPPFRLHIIVSCKFVVYIETKSTESSLL